MISVIVPVYNVANFLNDCLTSIINQSYNDIEIILVDDGSTDQSGEMCNKFAAKDERIRVIHQNNGGLSNARNVGLDVAKGKFVVFVDSDDYLHQKMIEKLYNAVVSWKADIACCDYTSIEFHNDSYSEIEVFKQRDAISKLFDDYGFQCFAWNKIYKSSLFEHIRYPERKLFEDIATTYQLFKRVNRVVYIKEKLYFYRQRTNSITKTKFNKRNRDLIDAIEFVYNDSMHCNLASERLKVGYLGYYLSYIQKGFTAKVDVDNEFNVLKERSRENLFSLIKEQNISAKKRIQLILIGVFPGIYKWLCRDLKLIRKV